MNKNTHFLALLLAVCPLSLPAQDAASLALFGDELLAAGKINEAAAQYELTGHLNGDNSELLYKAAETYYRARDYRKAAECYSYVREEYERYELAGLRYARALKQEGRYDDAIDAFKQFARRYKGQRKAQIMAVVANEVKGCELALQMATQKASAVMPAEVKILPIWVNSPENEFSPVLFSDNLLYYSAISNGQVRLMRSQRQAGTWQKSAPAQLPESISARFGNGSFSPDGNRFYCTQCAEPAPAERGGNGLRTVCSLYMLRRSASGWSEPQRLRDYINTPNRTTTHPFVTRERGRELLFFASDRDGGFGGLDLYVCERPLDSDDLDFSFPQNLGNSVNTAGDEVTPFFDPAAQTLWFSSNSHLSVGGLDVFKAVRSGGKWSRPENAGLPVNSPADDFFFSLKKNGGGGCLVSNRSFGEAKPNTLDEDIFEFFVKEPPVTLAGKVLESGTGQPLTDCMAALHELSDEGEWRLLEVRPSADGAFQFSILPERQYKVEVSKEGFVTLSAQPDAIEAELVIELERSSDGNKPAPVFAVQKGVGSSELSPDAPAHTGLSYKIHLEVQPDFEAQAPRYEEARNFGQVIAEPMPEQGIIRVLLGDFSDLKSANEVAAALRKSGSFPQAFVLKTQRENKN